MNVIKDGLLNNLVKEGHEHFFWESVYAIKFLIEEQMIMKWIKLTNLKRGIYRELIWDVARTNLIRCKPRFNNKRACYVREIFSWVWYEKYGARLASYLCAVYGVCACNRWNCHFNWWWVVWFHPVIDNLPLQVY